MFWAGLVFLLVVVGVSVVRWRLKTSEFTEKAPEEHTREYSRWEHRALHHRMAQGEIKITRKVLTYVRVGFTGLMILFFFLSTFTIIPAGHIGVQVLLGKVMDRYLSEGVSWKHPIASVKKMSIRELPYTMSKTVGEGEKEASDEVKVLTADQLHVPIDLTVPYSLNPAAGPWVWRYWGPEYKALLRPSFREGIRGGCKEFDWDSLSGTGRDSCATLVTERIQQRINKMAVSKGWDREDPIFFIGDTMIRDIVPPDKVKDAIEEKLAKQQEAIAYDYVLERERKEALRKAIDAGGIKEYQDIVSRGITQELLEWKKIEAKIITTELIAKSENAKVFMIDSGSIPLVFDMARK